MPDPTTGRPAGHAPAGREVAVFVRELHQRYGDTVAMDALTFAVIVSVIVLRLLRWDSISVVAPDA